MARPDRPSPLRRFRRPFRRFYRRFVIQPQAAYVVSFPKSGRTWLRLLLASVFASMTGRPLSLDLTNYRDSRRGIPYILFSHDGTDHAEWRSDLQDKRAFAGHPVLLLVRDPRDILVSYYFDLTRRSRRFEGDLAAFARSPQFGMDRIIAFLNSWADQARLPSRLTILRYEDLHADAPAALRRALEFFEVPAVPDALVTAAVAEASFARMREMEAQQLLGDGRLRPADPADPESYKVRRGRVGGYAEYLTDEQIRVLTDRMRRELAAPFRAYWV